MTPQRSLALIAVRGGLAAVAVPLGILMLIALIGWFLSDGGMHGSPRDALRVGALGWLVAHGSGVHIRGAEVTAVPIGLTLLTAYAVWRGGARTGEQLSSHGPDALALSDGERDLTVPSGAMIFTTVYVLAALAVAIVAGSLETQPSLGAVVFWSLVLAGGVGTAGIATGSGRAAVWLARVPLPVRDTVVDAVRMLGWFLSVSAIAFVVAFAIDGAAALNVFSRLGTNLGGGIAFLVMCLLVVPNAVIFAGSYLLGPGFAVGTHTLVSPTVVVLGPVPLFPLLAALPDDGPTPVWTPFLVALPPLLAAVFVVRRRHAHPDTGWDVGALRGLSAGVVAAVLFAMLAAVAGGSVGPGRMADVGPAVGSVLFHAIVSLGIGGLVGGVVATWLTRRNPPPVEVVQARPAPDSEPTVVLGAKGGVKGDAKRDAKRAAERGTDGGASSANEPTIPLLGRLLRRKEADETVAGKDPDRG